MSAPHLALMVSSNSPRASTSLGRMHQEAMEKRIVRRWVFECHKLHCFGGRKQRRRRVFEPVDEKANRRAVGVPGKSAKSHSTHFDIRISDCDAQGLKL